MSSIIKTYYGFPTVIIEGISYLFINNKEGVDRLFYNIIGQKLMISQTQGFNLPEPINRESEGYRKAISCFQYLNEQDKISYPIKLNIESITITLNVYHQNSDQHESVSFNINFESEPIDVSSLEIIPVTME